MQIEMKVKTISVSDEATTPVSVSLSFDDNDTSVFMEIRGGRQLRELFHVGQVYPITVGVVESKKR